MANFFVFLYSNSFLFIQDPRNIEEKRREQENWVRNELKLPLHPYVIFAGPIDNLQYYVCLNGDLYTFKDATRAVECCYFCLAALKSFPPTCDFVWAFFEKKVYDFSFKNFPVPVSALAKELNKL